ncbi:MAG: T9SS type A sorting domain-containing protein [Ignavibacteria bacterium]|nr:T9SS type A sorting domain-containing protein [Ignavibacteria bacterium]
MKYILKIFPFFLIIIVCKSVFPQENWLRQQSPVSTVLLNCVFTDSLNGWAAGDSGVIIHTSDGGNNWLIQSTPVTYYINDIFFIDKNTGWAVANEFLLNGTTLLKTSNGGNNWTVDSFQDSSKIFRTIYFLDPVTGFLGGFEGAIYKTTDSGNNWFSTSNDSSFFSAFPVTKFVFISEENGFACGGQIDIAGVIWKTTDSGLSWTADGFSPEPFYDIFAENPDDIFAVGGDFEFGAQISKSTDSGQNWTYENLGFFGQAQSIDFRTPYEAWMPLGFAGTWAVSYDSGVSWKSLPATDNATLYSVDFTDSLHGWAVGTNGTILKYIKTNTLIAESAMELPESFRLFQNYPNPFNPKTRINFRIVRSGNVTLKIFNPEGREVAELLNSRLPPGEYNTSFDGAELPSGIYFCTLRVSEYSQTIKMMLLK